MALFVNDDGWLGGITSASAEVMKGPGAPKLLKRSPTKKVIGEYPWAMSVLTGLVED
jgi:hypothetical protein